MGDDRIDRDGGAAPAAIFNDDGAQRRSRPGPAQMRAMTSCTPPAEDGTDQPIGRLG